MASLVHGRQRAILHRATWLTIAFLAVAGCDDSDPDVDIDDADEGGGLVTNECGTFDPDETGTDSVIPQDPADDEIVGADRRLRRLRSRLSRPGLLPGAACGSRPRR